MVAAIFRLKSALGSFPRSSARYASSSSTLKLATAKKPSGAGSAPRASLPKVFGDLYRRIFPAGDPAATVFPILEQWVREGGTVHRAGLGSIIRDLRSCRRYAHALEVSLWMFEKPYFVPTSTDFAIRLDLIGIVNGIEEAESYFDAIPIHFRARDCYGSLLNCYARVRDIDKAENIMQKMRYLGFARSIFSRNVMLNLYYRTQNHDKLENFVREMQEEGIKFDNFTLTILITAYAATSNAKGIEKLLAQFENDPIASLRLDWTVYSTAANGYRKLGLYDKAFNLLKKLEELIGKKEEVMRLRNIYRKRAFHFLMTQYAAIGKKEEVMRVWNIYRKDGKIYNNGYLAIIDSLVKFDDLESAEKIFEEWESRKSIFDVRIPNQLIRAYIRKGNLVAANGLVKRTTVNGGKLDSKGWSYLSLGHVEHGNFPEAVECIKEAVSISERGFWGKPFQDSSATILEYLKDKGDVEGAEELMGLLKNKNLISLDVHNKLVNWIKDMESNVLAIDVLREHSNQVKDMGSNVIAIDALDEDSHKQTNVVSELVEEKCNNDILPFWSKFGALRTMAGKIQQIFN